MFDLEYCLTYTSPCILVSLLQRTVNLATLVLSIVLAYRDMPIKTMHERLDGGHEQCVRQLWVINESLESSDVGTYRLHSCEKVFAL